MLYCPGKGQELLSALGVNLECHASSIFLVLKPHLHAKILLKIVKLIKRHVIANFPGNFSQFRI